MIGTIIITHGDLGKQLLKTTENILGPQKGVHTISLYYEESIEQIKQKISEAVKQVEAEDGVIIFTDMIGGTPTNTSLSLAQKEKLEIITGVNLPMLLEFFSCREVMSLQELTDKLCRTGRNSIVNIKEIFLKKLAKQKDQAT